MEYEISRSCPRRTGNARASVLGICGPNNGFH